MKHTLGKQYLGRSGDRCRKVCGVYAVRLYEGAWGLVDGLAAVAERKR